MQGVAQIAVAGSAPTVGWPGGSRAVCVLHELSLLLFRRLRGQFVFIGNVGEEGPSAPAVGLEAPAVVQDGAQVVARLCPRKIRGTRGLPYRGFDGEFRALHAVLNGASAFRRRQRRRNASTRGWQAPDTQTAPAREPFTQTVPRGRGLSLEPSASHFAALHTRRRDELPHPPQAARRRTVESEDMTNCVPNVYGNTGAAAGHDGASRVHCWTRRTVLLGDLAGCHPSVTHSWRARPSLPAGALPQRRIVRA